VCVCEFMCWCVCVCVCMCVCKRAHFCLKVSYSTKNEMQHLHLVGSTEKTKNLREATINDRV
jgi:hypothetical protein